MAAIPWLPKGMEPEARKKPPQGFQTKDQGHNREENPKYLD